MKLSNIQKYPLFIILGLLGTSVLVVVSETIGFSRANFIAFADESYAVWVYPFYFLVSFLVFGKVFDISKKAKYYIIGVFIILLLWYYFTSEGGFFVNPIPFGIGAA